jgi:hypothetical protein
MGNPLSRTSVVECPEHGQRKPAFICKHLQHGIRIGFFQPDEGPNSEEPWEMAWCEDCNKVLAQEGEWNDRSEAFAGVMLICDGCFEIIRERNV